VAGIAQLKTGLPGYSVWPRPSDSTPKIVWPAGYQPTRQEIISTVKGQLGYIWLSGNRIRDLSFSWPVSERDLVKILSGLRETEVLRFFFVGQPVGGKTFAQLRKMPSLRRLGLGGCHISDADLAEVKTLSNVRELFLSENRITDAGIIQLREMKQLEKLGLQATRVTRSGVRELQQALPDCEISY
jgi:Leucine-rich repeat (LRR) protein